MTIAYTSQTRSDASSPSLPDLVAGDVALGYALERRSADQQRAALARALPANRTPAPVRDWLGLRLIRLGRAIAGAGASARTTEPAPSTRLGIS